MWELLENPDALVLLTCYIGEKKRCFTEIESQTEQNDSCYIIHIKKFNCETCSASVMCTYTPKRVRRAVIAGVER